MNDSSRLAVLEEELREYERIMDIIRKRFPMRLDENGNAFLPDTDVYQVFLRAEIYEEVLTDFLARFHAAAQTIEAAETPETIQSEFHALRAYVERTEPRTSERLDATGKYWTMVTPVSFVIAELARTAQRFEITRISPYLSHTFVCRWYRFGNGLPGLGPWYASGAGHTVTEAVERCWDVYRKRQIPEQMAESNRQIREDLKDL